MSNVHYRRAAAKDVPVIVALLADDILGAAREVSASGSNSIYYSAFAEIDADLNQYLCVVEDAGQVIGTLQLSFIPGLARGGTKRGQIEAVRITSDRRREKLGGAMFAWAIEECRSRGCSLIQLTTDKARPDAHRFYDRLGFAPIHIRYKLTL